jgi:ABC-2 type transport system permease protein
MPEFVVGPFKSVIRITAQVRKELIQVRRRPGAFLSLVFGPFLIMAIFGLGYTGIRTPLDTVIVIPSDLGLSRDVTYYQSLAGPSLTIRSVTDNATAARAQLAAQEIDLLVIAPADAEATFRSGHQAQIQVFVNSIDPVQAGYGEFLAQVVNRQLNQEIIRRAVEQGEAFFLGDDSEALTIPPDVVAAPTTVSFTNVAPIPSSVVSFAAPAALALMLQHMAITLTALSFVRERLSGTLELFRISPINALELVLAKYIGLGIVSAVVATVSALLLVGVLGVPMLGSVWLIAGVITLLVLASLGIGLIISVVSDSERQAVQLALLLLLASVFFSGFVLPVHEFREGVQYAAYTLPVTHGIRLLQDLMLRGTTTAWWEVSVLAGLALVFLILTTVLLRRTLRSG